MSPLELKVLNTLTSRWPQFSSTKFLARKKTVAHHSHVPATINRMRKKGVPIESAKQARVNDKSVPLDVSGYRLIALMTDYD